MKKLLIIGLVCMVCSVTANADLLAEYTFASNMDPTTENANVAAGGITVGSGITGAGRSGGSESLFARASVTDGANQISLANAIPANDYFSFTVAPDAGYEMDLTSLTFDLGYTRIGSFESKQFRTYLLTDIDGFTTGGLLGYDTVDVTVNGGSLQYPNPTASISLGGAQFQDLTGTVEFRLYIADNTGGNDYIHRIDNIGLNGTVSVIPEPATMGLLGIGGLVTMALRRRMTA